MAPKVTLFAHGSTPNPLKIAIFLEELNVDYAVVQKEMGDGPNGMKTPEFFKVNPNGRVPAIIDHTNNDKVVWESGAILLYLAERFSPDGKYHGSSLNERSEVWEWLFYQVSGLGPSQGQAAWFINFHPIKDLHPSVLERYQNESYRIYGTLEKRLAEQGEWLALKRLTIADIAHYPWLNIIGYAKINFDKYPNVAAYHKRIQALPSVTRAYEKVSKH